MNMCNKKVKVLGQVFTPSFVVAEMIWLIKNNGKTLEPSCWNWAFTNHLPNSIWIELDKDIIPIAREKNNNILNMNFFDYSIWNKFDTIIWNPPYVRFQDIEKKTKNKLDMKMFDKRSNLYLFFIKKSIDHLNDWWELIFITPRDFLKATSSIKLNEFVYKNWTITDVIDLWDQKVFGEFCPNTIIWRFEKNNYSRQTNMYKRFVLSQWQLLFTSNEYNIKFSDIFFVKVGAVSWADPIFTITDQVLKKYPNIEYKEFVWSFTAKKRIIKRMLYNEYHEYLDQYKVKLINRKIKKFTENNWRKWGRGFFDSDKKRIYVNWKTRNKNPFFIYDSKYYDWSILAIFPHKENLNLEELCNDLNSINWEELWFVCDWRYLFSQKSLENTILPSTFKKYL